MTDSSAKIMSALCGVVLAFCISMGVRLETGYPPGVRPPAFEHLLGKPAPWFEVPGLDGAMLSLPDMEAVRAGAVVPEPCLLFLADTASRTCDETYASLKNATDVIQVLVVATGVRKDIKTKLALNGVTAPTGYDSLASVMKAYDVHEFPGVLLVDAGGVVRAAENGTGSVERILETWSSMQQERM